jgi:hypothetical protein
MSESNNLNQPHFKDADKARTYLERLRWPNGPVCPHRGSMGNHYHLEGKSTRPGVDLAMLGLFAVMPLILAQVQAAGLPSGP